MAMVGRLGPTAVAAVGVSGQMFNMIMAISLAVTTGTISLVARYTGAKDEDNANAVLGQSLLLGTVFSALLMIPGLAASAMIFRLFGAEASVTDAGVPYLRIIVSGTFFLVVALVAASALRGAGDTKTPLIISVAANIINVFLNYVLIFGKFGFPRLEVTGAGIATIIAFFLEAVAFVVLLTRGNLALSLTKRALKFEKTIVLKTLRIGTPSALEHGTIQLGYLWYMAVITGYGTDPLAAYMIGVNVMSLSFMPGFGFSVAASALVGQSLGAEEPDAAAAHGWESTKMALLAMSAVGVALFAAARPIALIYVADPNVVALTAEFIRILAGCQPAMALHFTLSGALIGAADTRWPLYASFIGMYFIRMPLALLAAYVLDLNITWIWMIIFADHYGKSVVLFLRFLSGKWKLVKV
jgi:putative MATE family efflux protein